MLEKDKTLTADKNAGVLDKSMDGVNERVNYDCWMSKQLTVNATLTSKERERAGKKSYRYV